MLAVSIGLAFGAGSEVCSLRTEVSLLDEAAGLAFTVAERTVGARAMSAIAAGSALRRSRDIGILLRGRGLENVDRSTRLRESPLAGNLLLPDGGRTRPARRRARPWWRPGIPHLLVSNPSRNQEFPDHETSLDAAHARPHPPPR